MRPLACSEVPRDSTLPRSEACTLKKEGSARLTQPAQSVKASGDDVTIERLPGCQIVEANETTKGDRKYFWVRITTADGRTLQCIADDPKVFPALRVGRGEVELRRSPAWKYARVTGAAIEVAK